MIRFHDWESRLADYIESVRNIPFTWGSFDCCLFACDAVMAMTGLDMAEDFRGKYSTDREALVALREFAGGGVAELAAKRALELGIREVVPAMAQRGDVVLVDNQGNDALGIVGLDGLTAYCAGVGGLVELPRKFWKTAYRIGELLCLP